MFSCSDSHSTMDTSFKHKCELQCLLDLLCGFEQERKNVDLYSRGVVDFCCTKYVNVYI